MGMKKVDADVEMQVDDPAPEYDFDKETLGDPYAYATYAHDVFVYYVFREVVFANTKNAGQPYFSAFFCRW